jgi:hypothetical protein
MRLANFVRLGSLAALLAGVSLLVSQLLGRLSLDFLPFRLSGGELSIYGFMGINGYLGVLLAVLMQLGLIGLYVPQAKTTRILGGGGFLLAFVGTRLALGPSFIDPILIKPSEWSLGGLPNRKRPTLFGSPAISRGDPWALRPRLATGLPFSQQPPCEEMRLLPLINA